MRTNKVIDQSFQSLKEHLNLDLDWQADINAQPSMPDGELRLRIENKNFRISFVLKEEVRKYQIERFIELKGKRKNFIVIAGYISKQIQNIFKDERINYIDSSGNSFIQLGNYHIATSGLKNKVSIFEDKNLFTATQLKLLFYFLQEPDLINKTYREIANTAKVSLDIVSKSINGMKNKNWLIHINEKKQKLNRINELYEKWLNGFEETLKPKISKGNYRFLGDDFLNNWKKTELEKNRILWGAEPAAAILTDYLLPEKFLLYTTLQNQELLKYYKLVPDVLGEVEIRNLFFDPGFFNCQDTVPPILIYSDLIISGDSRNRETAKKIYEKFLANLIG